MNQVKTKLASYADKNFLASGITIDEANLWYGSSKYCQLEAIMGPDNIIEAVDPLWLSHFYCVDLNDEKIIDLGKRMAKIMGHLSGGHHTPLNEIKLSKDDASGAMGVSIWGKGWNLMASNQEFRDLLEDHGKRLADAINDHSPTGKANARMIMDAANQRAHQIFKATV